MSEVVHGSIVDFEVVVVKSLKRNKNKNNRMFLFCIVEMLGLGFLSCSHSLPERKGKFQFEREEKREVVETGVLHYMHRIEEDK